MAENNDAETPTDTEVLEDWEKIVGEEVQQRTSDKLKFIEQQQKNEAEEQRCLNEPGDNVANPSASAGKPIRLLKRERPIRRISESEPSDLTKTGDGPTFDERRANYDKIRERIFNASISTDDSKAEKTASPVESEAPDNEISIEMINHLSDVQMLSDEFSNVDLSNIPPRCFLPNMQRGVPPFPMRPPIPLTSSNPQCPLPSTATYYTQLPAGYGNIPFRQFNVPPPPLGIPPTQPFVAPPNVAQAGPQPLMNIDVGLAYGDYKGQWPALPPSGGPPGSSSKKPIKRAGQSRN